MLQKKWSVKFLVGPGQICVATLMGATFFVDIYQPMRGTEISQHYICILLQRRECDHADRAVKNLCAQRRVMHIVYTRIPHVSQPRPTNQWYKQYTRYCSLNHNITHNAWIQTIIVTIKTEYYMISSWNHDFAKKSSWIMKRRWNRRRKIQPWIVVESKIHRRIWIRSWIIPFLFLSQSE